MQSGAKLGDQDANLDKSCDGKKDEHDDPIDPNSTCKSEWCAQIISGVFRRAAKAISSSILKAREVYPFLNWWAEPVAVVGHHCRLSGWILRVCIATRGPFVLAFQSVSLGPGPTVTGANL